MGFVAVVGLVGEFVDLVIILSLLEGLVGIPGFRNQEEKNISQARRDKSFCCSTTERLFPSRGLLFFLVDQLGCGRVGLWRQLTNQRQQH